jgi:hemerythrin-like domain-containing protein
MGTSLLSEQAAPSFDDPLGMLVACHGRIKRQFATLARLQQHLPEHGISDDARNAARAVLRYFDTAAVNHHADEEESVFPRLVRLRGSEAQTIADELERDHERLAMRIARLRPYLVAIERGERADLPADVVEDARAAYEAHIAREESALIPLANAALDAAALREIGAEMARRRGVDPLTARPD